MVSAEKKKEKREPCTVRKNERELMDCALQLGMWGDKEIRGRGISDNNMNFLLCGPSGLKEYFGVFTEKGYGNF